MAATRVYVDAELVRACEVADTREFYAFDAFIWENPNSDALKDLAHCLARGRLKGRQVRLVDHGTPGAPDRSEEKFGKSRAAMVREYLLFHGVKQEAVLVQPDDARPGAHTQEARRVDLELIP